jgi:hypothetical protein
VTSKKRGGASTKLVFLVANCTPVRSEIADKSLSHSVTWPPWMSYHPVLIAPSRRKDFHWVDGGQTEGLSPELRQALEPLLEGIEELSRRIGQYNERIEALAQASYPQTVLLNKKQRFT